MKYTKAKTVDPFLSDLTVENIFISEFMTAAPGDYVKVYLYGRFLSDQGINQDAGEMASQLGISESRVTEAWNYWEENLAIRKRGDDIVFLNLKEVLYGVAEVDQEEEFRPAFVNGDEEDDSPDPIPKSKTKSKSKSDPTGKTKALMDAVEEKLGRPLSIKELETAVAWTEDMGGNPDVILMAVDYCLEAGKSNFRYIQAVVEGWIGQGLSTEEDVKGYLEEFDQKFARYRRVMQALGMSRNSTEEERRLIDSWFDDMGYMMPKVLDACATTASTNSPSIKYVDAVLRNWSTKAKKENRNVNEDLKVSNTELKEYYDYLREKADREAEERREEIYMVLPEIQEIDEQMRDIGIRLAKSILSGGEGDGENLNAKLQSLNEDRAICLAENDYDVNYTDPHYRCTRCNDTGIAEMGGPCDCREQRRAEAEIWLKNRKESA